MTKWLVSATVLVTIPGVSATGNPESERPESYQGLTASLSIDKAEQKADEALEVTVTFTCTTDPHRLFNPFFNGLLERPGRIVVRNSKGEVVNKLLEFHGGSSRSPREGDYVNLPGKGFVGGKVRVYPSRRWLGDPLPPGKYTLQLELYGVLLGLGGESHSKVIVTTERVAYRIVK
jgi:hypothetical protein